MWRKCLSFLVIGCSFSLAGAASAADFTWVGNDPKGPTAWNNPNNWSPTGIPGSTDRAILHRGATAVLDTNVQIDALTMDTAASIGGVGAMTVTTSIAAVGANFTGTGALNIPKTCRADFDILGTAGKNTLTRPVNNQGIAYLNSGDLVLNADFQNKGAFYADSEGTISWNTKVRPKFVNQGEFIKDRGTGTSTLTTNFSNVGEISCRSGNIDLGPGFTQSAGGTSLDGGDIIASTPLQLQGGTLDGTGQIRGDVNNTGASVGPGHSPGSIVILGNYTQTAGGTLDMQIAGVNPGSQYDQLQVHGIATLAGTLNITLLNGYQPSVGDSFSLLEYISVVGSFSQVNGLTLPGKNYFKTSYTPSDFLAVANADTVPPKVTVTAPVAGLNPGLTTASGTALDNESGLASVTARLYRASPSGYWNGSSWDTTYNASADEVKVTGTNSWTLTLPKLASGQYTLRATATDLAQNTAASSAVAFQVDYTAPTTLTCTNPLAGAYLTKFTAFKGTAADDTGGSGIARVDVFLRRVSDNTYWNGSAWGTQTAMATTLSGTSWTSTTALPTGSNLPDGNYEITTSAVDKAALTTNLVIPVSVDATLPTGTIAVPTAGAILTALPTKASGTAADASSGLASLTLRIARSSGTGVTAGYWNGTSWDATYSAALHELPVSGTSTWSCGLPTGSNVLDTKYTLRLTAKDKAGNTTTASADVSIDSKAPTTTTLDTPATGSYLTKLTAVSGTAADAAGGQGILRVDLQIRRASDSKYWTGSVWQSGAVQLKTKLSGTTWSIDTASNALPSGSNLPDGGYTLTATAYDKANNNKSASSTITVDATLPKVVVSSPANSSNFPQLASFQGTASDTTSGVARVSIRLYRYSSAAGPAGYWNGSTWTSTYSAAVNEITATGTTSWSLALPALTEGKYYGIATAYDNSGNKVSSPTTNFNIDATAPTVSFVSPVANAQVKTLPALNGKAADTLAGIATITLKLKRFDNLFWSGSAWVASGSISGSYTTASTSWNYSGSLPTGTNLPEGVYQLSVTATDKAGNAATANTTVTVDKTVPSVAVLSPTASTYSVLDQISGNASDGVGLAVVDVRLSRSAYNGTPAGYWNGSTWNTTYDSTIDDVPAQGLQSWFLDLPTLPDGHYTVKATAKDNAGNSTTSASVSFTVTSGAAAIVAPSAKNW